MNALVNTVQLGARAPGQVEIWSKFVVGRTGLEDRCVRV
jgi:hypothetical protein